MLYRATIKACDAGSKIWAECLDRNNSGCQLQNPASEAPREEWPPPSPYAKPDAAERTMINYGAGIGMFIFFLQNDLTDRTRSNIFS